MVFALVGVSAPVFWLAYLSLYVFWFKLQWLPPSGIPIGDSVLDAVVQGRFIMPWFVLAFAFAAFYARMVRGNLIETMGEDYIRTARAKGASETAVNYDHALRNAVLPVVTIIGIEAAFLIGGLIVTETVFNIPGVARFLVEAIRWRDYPIVQNLVMFIAIVVVVVNFIVDMSYAVLDPRIKYEE